MKRLIITLLVIVILIATVSNALAEKTLGYETIVLLSMLDGFLTPFGINTYPMTMTEQEKAQLSFVKPYTRHCSVYITQINGHATSLKITSDEDDGSSSRIDEIMACFMAGIMITDFSISASDAIDYLTKMADTGQTVVLNGLQYRIITGRPFTTIISLEIIPV